MPTEPTYWFPAKRYGWGWGLPSAWQGWAVLAGFAVLLLVGLKLFPPNRDLVSFLAYVVLLTALLVAICWLKGEPPRWRWGKSEDA
jgi:uncharacterized membrane protein YhaH (DUF805 family)